MWNLKDKLTRRFVGTARRFLTAATDVPAWTWKIDLVEQRTRHTVSVTKPLTNPVGTPRGVHVSQCVIPRSVYAQATAEYANIMASAWATFTSGTVAA